MDSLHILMFSICFSATNILEDIKNERKDAYKLTTFAPY